MARRYHSPSSTELGARCPRAWAYCYIDKLRDPEVVWDESMATRLPPGVTAKQRSGALGTAGHKVLEAWYLGGTPAWHTYPGQVVEAGRHLLPTPGAVTAMVEAPIGDEPIADPGDGPAVGLRFGGVLWAGFRDLVVTGGAETERLGLRGAVVLFDYKTTASIAKYAKDADALRADLQCNLYALATMIEVGVPWIACRWVYFETKAVRRALPTDVVIRRADAEARVNAASVLAAELDLLERSADAPQNVDACGDYGGCSYHVSVGGPCDARRSVGKLIQLRRKAMPLTEEQKAKFAKFGKKDTAPAETPEVGAAEAPTDAAPTETPKAAPAPKAKAKAKAPAAGGLAAIIAEHQAAIAQAETDLAIAQGQKDAAIAALRAVLA
jgi:hypothetical protein